MFDLASWSFHSAVQQETSKKDVIETLLGGDQMYMLEQPKVIVSQCEELVKISVF